MKQAQEKKISMELGEGEGAFENALLSSLIRGADELRKRLHITENSFNFLGRVHNQRGRDHYIYAVLDEVEQAAIALMQSQELFKETPKDIPSDEQGKRILRNTLSVIDRDQSLQMRRLIEILVDLINFFKTNSNVYYDHYLLYKELAQHKKRKDDFKRYFNCDNLNTQSSIDLIKQSIAYGEAKLQLGDCWYLQGNSPKPNGDAEAASFQSCFDKALTLATKTERLVLGFYYGQAYRTPSQSIHLSIGGLVPEMSFELQRLRRGQLGLIAAHCLLRCRRLLRIRTREGVSSEIARALDKAPGAISLYRQNTQPDIIKGDMVAIFGSLCEVKEVKKSKYGYKSFKVRFISDPLIHKEDCFPAIYVKKVVDGRELRKGVIELLRSFGATPPSPRRIREAMRKSALDIWNRYVAAKRNA